MGGVHLSSLEVLEGVDVVVKKDGRLGLLEEGGVRVDHERGTARIGQHLVEEALASAPSLIRL